MFHKHICLCTHITINPIKFYRTILPNDVNLLFCVLLNYLKKIISHLGWFCPNCIEIKSIWKLKKLLVYVSYMLILIVSLSFYVVNKFPILFSLILTIVENAKKNKIAQRNFHLQKAQKKHEINLGKLHK